MRFNRFLAIPALLAAVAAVQASQAQTSSLKIPRDDVAAFVDGMLDIQMKRDDTAGAEVFLSVEGETLISQGYGLANVATKQRMSDQTIVQTQGLAAAVISVAVMQQVEAGRLSLDADVSRYVDVALPTREDGPVTLRQLLTHSAGLSAELGSGKTLHAQLTTAQLRRPYPAGRVNRYSAYGLALAAYAVERVTHEPIEGYVSRHIFTPLGMTHSTLLEPLPASLAPQASQAYGASTAPPLAPAHALGDVENLSTTAHDLGLFGAMLAGSPSTVLSAASIKTMLSRQAVPGLTADIPAMALGLHEVWFNGSRLFGVSGDGPGFHSELQIDPVRKIVLFVVYNSDGHRPLPGQPYKLAAYSRGELIHGIFDRYQPFHPAVTPFVPSTDDEAQMTGMWIAANAKPSAQVLHTRVDSHDHTLVVDRFISDRDTVKHWAMIGKGLWQQYPQDRIYFIAGKDGLPDRLALAADPATHWLRVQTK